MGCDLLQWEITGKYEFMGNIYIYQLGFTGAVQFRDGTLDPSNVRVKCPISELDATVKITHSNIIIKISHPKQWEENHTLKLRLRFRDGTIRPPVRANVPSLNQTPMLGLNIALWQRHGSIPSSIR